MAELYLPFGPVEGKPVIDEFTYEDVKETECKALPSRTIGSYLIDRAEAEGTKYLCVCVPCYNEDLEELMKTLVSLMENFDFMIKKVSEKLRNPTFSSLSSFLSSDRLVSMTIRLERHSKKSSIQFVLSSFQSLMAFVLSPTL